MALSLGIVVWGQSPAKHRAQPRNEMKSRCPGKAMQKKESLQSGMNLAWIGCA